MDLFWKLHSRKKSQNLNFWGEEFKDLINKMLDANPE